MNFQFYFFKSHQQNNNQGIPRSLPAVIESLPVVKVTKEEVGKSWLCILR